jgi:hypothetical protein
MLTNNNIKFSGVFDLAHKNVDGTPNTNFRTITLKDEVDYTGYTLADMSGYFIVKSPTGVVLHQGNFGTPDIVQSTSLEFDELNIPLDSLGAILNGIYKISYHVKNDDTGIIYESIEVSVLVCDSNCDCKTEGSLKLEINCDSALAVAKDTTKYASGSVLDREITLRPPLGSRYSNGTAASNYKTVLSSAIISDALWTGVWEATLSAVVEHPVIEGDMNFTIVEYVYVYTTAEATCDVNLCSLYKCITKEFDQIKKQGSRQGGLSNNIDLLDRIELIQTEYISMEVARSCGNKTNVVKHYNVLKDMLDCDCGCGSTDSPVLIEAIAPTGNNVAISGSYPIVVTPAVDGDNTTYTVSLSQNFLDLLNALRDVRVANNDGTITVTAVTSSPNITTYVLAANADEILNEAFEGLDLSCLGLGSGIVTAKDVIQELINNACEVPPPPLARNDYSSINQDTQLIYDIFQNDVQPSATTVTITGAPTNGNANVEAGGILTYTPNEGWNGTEIIEYTLEDAYGQTSTATVTIIVNPITPVACGIVNALYTMSGYINDENNPVISLANQTNYGTNVPTSVSYYISILDADGNTLLSMSPVAGENSPTPPTVVTIPYEYTGVEFTIRVVMWVYSETSTGEACAIEVYEPDTNLRLDTNANEGFMGGIDTSCAADDLPPDPVESDVVQWLLDKVCEFNALGLTELANNVAYLLSQNTTQNTLISNLTDRVDACCTPVVLDADFAGTTWDFMDIADGTKLFWMLHLETYGADIVDPRIVSVSIYVEDAAPANRMLFVNYSPARFEEVLYYNQLLGGVVAGSMIDALDDSNPTPVRTITFTISFEDALGNIHLANITGNIPRPINAASGSQTGLATTFTIDEI